MKKLIAILLLLFVGVGQVQAQALNDPSISGMKDLPRVEGCMAPGGLFPITSSDGPNDAMFWCGAPPYCLTLAVGAPGRCHIIPGSRGPAGTTGVRDPQDLLCDVASTTHPTGPTHATPGRCPIVPVLSVSINGAAAVTVTRPAAVTLFVSTATSEILGAPTAIGMSCTGAQVLGSPFGLTDLNFYAGQEVTFPAAPTTATGTTTCTVTASNAAGSISRSASFTALDPIPQPTVTASFNPTAPTAGGTVSLTTVTTNATSLTWSCRDRWVVSDPVRAIGTLTTDHTATGDTPGSATCTFVATGPGGQATATASWTSVAAAPDSGGGGGSCGCPNASAHYVNGNVDVSCYGGVNIGGAQGEFWFSGIAAGTPGTVRTITGGLPNSQTRFMNFQCMYVCYQDSNQLTDASGTGCPNSTPRTSWSWSYRGGN